MSALSNKNRKIYADAFSSLPMNLLLSEVGRREEHVRVAEMEVAKSKAIRALANRELKRRKRKEAKNV